MISISNGKLLKSVNNFSYLGNSISSTKSDFCIHLRQAFTVIDRLPIIWKPDLSNKISLDFSQVVAMSLVLHDCTI